MHSTSTPVKAFITLCTFTVRGDERGSLIALEAEADVPFEVKRVYYIFGTAKGVSRGFHAHRNLKQLLIAVSGKVRIHCELEGRTEEVWLDSPDKGLCIEGLVWREMHDFTPDCVLMVLGSEHYDEGDYIREYAEFRRVLEYA